MPLTPHLDQFHQRWRQKAAGYGDVETRDWFDRFFSLYVVFNALYTEAALDLERNGLITLDSTRGIPDDRASQEYVVQYVGAKALVKALTDDPAVTAALAQIEQFLQQHTYHFRLNRLTGNAQDAEDERILVDLQSNDTNAKACSVLEVLYCVRCNMFHGHKMFEPVQVDLLRPVIIILAKVIDIIHARLGR